MNSVKKSKRLTLYIKAACVFTSFFILQYGSAQSSPSTSLKNVAIKDSLGYVNLSFEENTLIDNLLIVISDSKGNTLFLDNKRRYSGHYYKSVNLGEFYPGEFLLNIICDQEKFTKKISLSKK